MLWCPRLADAHYDYLGIGGILHRFYYLARSFYILRFLLGVAEAGFFPGILFYFRPWVPNTYRGRATVMILSASAAAFLFSGPITGAILSLHNVLTLPGWKWVMFLEGFFSIAIGVIVSFILVSSPRQARWLSARERDALTTRLADEEEARSRLQSGVPSRMALLFDRQMLFYCVIFFTMTMTGYNPGLLATANYSPHPGLWRVRYRPADRYSLALRHHRHQSGGKNQRSLPSCAG